MKTRPGSVLLAALVAAACAQDVIAPRLDPGPPPLVASETVMRLAAGVTWVALADHAVPRGAIATVHNVSNGSRVTSAMRDGGFDPVPVPAAPGDSIVVTAIDSAGHASVTSTTVPVRRP